MLLSRYSLSVHHTIAMAIFSEPDVLTMCKATYEKPTSQKLAV